MELRVNGERRTVPEALTVTALLQHLKVAPGPVAVEVNGTVVKKAEHGAHALKDGDVVEVVAFVGGG